MPRYYFDVSDSKGPHVDMFGEELHDVEEARQLAQCLLPDIARDELPDGDMCSFTCNVRDATGQLVYRGELTYRGVRL